MEPSQTGLALPELRCSFQDRSFVPDIAVFRWERIPLDADDAIANSFSAAPDWSIKILSPDQSSTRVISNLLFCIENGTELGWLVDPREELVQVFRQRQPPLFIESSSTLLPVPDFAQSIDLTVGEI
ncbi:MAG: Uma2 family endonuclease [Cyanobacteria bacterium P01_H01_bin.15]